MSNRGKLIPKKCQVPTLLMALAKIGASDAWPRTGGGGAVSTT